MMSKSIIELLIEDIQGRDTVGRAKYGKPLLSFDGRRTLQDAYEEALDLAVYIKKEMVERAELERRIAERDGAKESDKYAVYMQGLLDKADAALSATGQQEHPDTVTVKHCCGESGFGREWPGEPRDVCQVCAKRAEQWEREALEEETPQLVEFAVGVDEEADRG